MPNHITARMAWHDNKWNGRVCIDPEGNSYCVGPHSLLSDRLAKDKKESLEHEHAEEKIDQIPDYLPPCFWSGNAFGSDSQQIRHDHPVPGVNKTIEEKLAPYSVFTWPFWYSFVRGRQAKKLHGKYPPNLEETSSQYFGRIEPRKSLVFFYLNYSNPISAEEYKYALIGCSMISHVGPAFHYDFTKTELAAWRAKSHEMKNFPTVNWARQITHDFKRTGVLLPYHEYLAHIEEKPEDEHLLREMQVLIEEDSLIPCFKYVSRGVNDDQCIYLLYRLGDALDTAQKHGIVKVEDEVKTIQKLLRTAWENRGLYPSLPKIVCHLTDEEDAEMGNRLISATAELYPDNTPVDAIFDLFVGTKAVPSQLADYKSQIQTARISLRDRKDMVGILKKLSLFSLTRKQIKRVLSPEEQDPLPFPGKDISYEAICKNPYLLCEEYIPEDKEYDNPESNDGPIDVFTIDIGMFPDKRYFDSRDFELQNLAPISKERIRALIVEFLKSMTRKGHSYMSLDQVYDEIKGYPLFYKEELGFSKQTLGSKPYLDYFSGRLALSENENEVFVYLKEIQAAEQLVKKSILDLLSRKEHDVDTKWIGRYLKGEARDIAQDNDRFDAEVFLKEREHLLESALTKSFFVIGGRPGSGKTHALRKVIEKLTELGEEVTLLTPTGKATLRARKEAGFDEAQTIDRFLCKHGYHEYVDSFRAFEDIKPLSSENRIANLIIDECSMLSLEKIAVLLKLIHVKGPNALSRLILVGDENQLPPIGCGRPLFDIVDFLTRTYGADNPFMVRLQANCRQKFDEEILRYADLFVGGNRYFQEGFDELKKGGQISKGLIVDLWSSGEELEKKVRQRLDSLIAQELGKKVTKSQVSNLNLLFGLYDKGFVTRNDPTTLEVDKFQILTPYNSGRGGAIPLNATVQRIYKSDYLEDPRRRYKQFVHSDKVICVSNYYWWHGGGRDPTLVLSNGSMGIFCINTDGPYWYFPDREEGRLKRIDSEDYFEQAYAITVHKAQGSEFKNVFVVVPERRGLLSRELLYTALTRSTHRMFLFLKADGKTSPLDIARNRSDLLVRQTSLFEAPSAIAGKLEPAPGVFVRSREEYIIFRTLLEHQEKGSLRFEYEKELHLEGIKWPVKPDFTVWIGDKVYYWEHLGMLDRGRYYKNWQERRSGYSRSGFEDNLITTDNLRGIHQNAIDQVIRNMLDGSVKAAESEFSQHHYQL